MTIEEAIEQLKRMLPEPETLAIREPFNYQKAIQLGIEALEMIQRAREYKLDIVSKPLPSEGEKSVSCYGGKMNKFLRFFYPTKSIKRLTLIAVPPLCISLAGIFSHIFVLWVVGTFLQVIVIILIVLSARRLEPV